MTSKAWAQEDKKDIYKRYEQECYLDEQKDRDSWEQVVKNCTQIGEEAKEEIKNITDKGKKKFWIEHCSDLEYKRPRAFAVGDPTSCLPLGELLIEYNQAALAKKSLQKACGIYLNPKSFAANKEKALAALNKYGCVVADEIRDYKLTDAPKCSTERLLACLKLGDIFQKDEDFDKSKIYYSRACSGGLGDACQRLKNVSSRSTLLKYTGIILIGLSIFIVTNMMFLEQSQAQASDQLEDGESKEAAAKHGAILRYSRPFFKRYLTPIVSAMKYRKTVKEKYKRPMAAAGLTGVLTPEDFFSFKLFLILGFPIVFLISRAVMGETWPLSYIPLIAVGGFFYPDIWVKGKIQNRQKDVVLNMPFAVDMLALSVESGLDFIAAMTKVVEKARPSSLTEEFGIVIREIKIGASRAEALRNMSWRINLIQISSFCATLIAADSVGASIGPILKALSVEIRQKKSSDVEKAGATAATKILFPMMFLIVPAVFLIVAGPILLEFVAGAGGK